MKIECWICKREEADPEKIKISGKQLLKKYENKVIPTGNFVDLTDELTDTESVAVIKRETIKKEGWEPFRLEMPKKIAICPTCARIIQIFITNSFADKDFAYFITEALNRHTKIELEYIEDG